MKKICKLLIAILFLLLIISCRRDNLSIYQVLSQPYVKTNGEMGLSVYVRTSISDVENASMQIVDPSGNLTWTASLNEVDYQGTVYQGNSDIVMPMGSVLPKGVWNIELIYKDGRTVSSTFNVDYKDSDSVLDRLGTTLTVVFDAESNLTVVPYSEGGNL